MNTGHIDLVIALVMLMKMVFTGKIEIKVISADLTDFTVGKKPDFKKENMNCYVRILVGEVELGETEICQKTEKYELY